MRADNTQSDSLDPERVQELVATVLAASDAAAELARIRKDHPALHPKVESIYQRLVREELIPPQAPPKVLGNHVDGYRLVRRLGRGGMGVVHLAEQAEPRRLVALKLLRPDLLDVESSRTRFRHEIMAVARLQHPGIVQVFESRDDAEIPYFVMEYVEGISMADLIRRLQGRPSATLHAGDLLDALEANGATSSGSHIDGEQSWDDLLLRIGLELCDALQHAHERGVLHRDVKPSNILLTREGRARLVDFGLARLEGETRLTRSEAELGSLPFIPPENLRGSVLPNVGRDVYGLGVTLYEFSSLHNPFLAEEPSETRRRILRGQAPSLRHWNPHVSWELETVIQKAMSPEPEQRYATARAFGEDLSRVAQHRPIQARRPSLVLRTRRWVEHHRGLAGMLAVTFVLLFAATLVFALRENQARRVSDRLTRESEQASYVAKIQLASMSLDRGGDLDEIRSLLASCPERLRHFEWRHLVEKLDSSSGSIPVPEGRVDNMSWSSDGRNLAAFTGKTQVIILDPHEPKPRLRWKIPHLSTEALKWRPGHRQIVYALTDGTLRLRDLDPAQAIRTLLPEDPERGRAAALLFTQDGKVLYTGHASGQVLRIDLVGGSVREIVRFPGQSIFSLSLSGDEKTMVIGAMASGASTPALTAVHDLVHDRTRTFVQNGTLITSSVIDRRGEFVFVGSQLGLELIDLRTDKRRLLYRGVSRHPVLSDDETRLAFVGRHSQLYVFRVERQETADGIRIRGRRQAEMLGHQQMIFSLTSEPGSHRFFTGGDDTEIKIWDPDHESPVYQLPGTSHLVTAMLPLEEGILIGDSKGGLLMQRDEGSRAFSQLSKNPVASMDRGADGSILVAFKDGPLACIDSTSGQPIWTRRIDGLTCALLLPGGYAYGTKTGRLQVGVGQERKAIPMAGWEIPWHSRTPISAMDQDAAGQLLVVGNAKGEMACFDLARHREMWRHRAEEGWISDLRIDPLDRFVVSVGQDKTVAIWQLHDGKLLHRLEGMDRASMALCFSPDGRRLVTASGYAGDLRIWDFPSGHMLARLTAGCAPFAVCFRSGALVTAGFANSTIGLGGRLGEITCFRGRSQVIPRAGAKARSLDTLTTPPLRIR